MNADEIEACNAQFFAGPIPGLSVERMCQPCAELSYVTLHAGDKCPTCDGDMAAKEDLPRLCDRCHIMLEEYGRWLQTLTSSDDEGSKTFRQTNNYIGLSESSFSANCEMSKTLKLEGKPYRKPVLAPKRLPVQFALQYPRDTVLNHPFAAFALHLQTPSVMERAPVWIASCNGLSGHPATELQFQTLLNLDLWLIDVDDRRLIRLFEAEDIVYAALSYVWGGPQPTLLKENVERMREPGALDRPNSCSQTIRDAIVVCR